MSPKLELAKIDAFMILDCILRRDILEPHDRKYLREFFETAFKTFDRAEQQGVVL